MRRLLPRADRGQRALIDIDDAYGVGGIDYARLHLLQHVKGDQPEPRDGLRIDPAQCDRSAKCQPNC
jgi:hypothetical protein